MGDGPLGDVTHAERRELDALRLRAYGPDADIFGDDAALARLRQLEDRLRLERLTPSGGAAPDVPVALARSRGRRRRVTLIAGTIAAAALLGVAGWNAGRIDPSAEVGPGAPTSSGQSEEERAAEYERYLDGLREDVLSLPGSEPVASRILHDELRPYGILYGRTVGAGPTVDNEFCMIIADLPASSITCIPADGTRAEAVSVTLPSWYSDADSDEFTGLGGLVSYTLLPGGTVVAVPAD